MQDQLHRIGQDVGEIKGTLVQFCERLERHDHAIFGNGKLGIEKRLDRVEVAARLAGKSRKSFWSAVLAIVGAVISAGGALVHGK